MEAEIRRSLFGYKVEFSYTWVSGGRRRYRNGIRKFRRRNDAEAWVDNMVRYVETLQNES